VRLLDLAVDQLEAGGDCPDMRACRFSGLRRATVSGCCRKIRSPSAAVIRRMRWVLRTRSILLSRTRAALAGVGTAATARETSRPRGRPRSPALRVIAPELFTHTVGKSIAFLLQVLGHARRFAQLDHHRLLGNETDSDRPVAAAIARPVYCIAPTGGSKSVGSDHAVDKRAGGNGGRLGFFFPVAPRAGDAFTHEPRSPAPRRVSKSRSGVPAYLGNKASLQ
jgi:hypothetical protein